MKKISLSLLSAFWLLPAAFSQRLGINTTTPQETLDVRGNGYFSDRLGIGITNPQFPLSFSPTLGDKISLWGNSGPNYGIGIQSYLMQIHTDGSLSDIAFGYGSSPAFTEKMRIKGNGNVGIGITNPGSTIDVYRGTAVGGTAQFRGTQNISHFNYDTNEDTYIRGGKNGAHVILNDLAGTGNVGIGTASPSQKLHVIGNICATGTIGACSDIRYKQNLSPISHSLSSLLSLQGFYYYWKNNEFAGMQFDDARQLGFSAQEVEKLFPEIVMTDVNGYKAVDYGRLTPVLVEAIKEQQKQINAQQQQIDELKKDKLQMQEQMAELKKMMEKSLK